MDSALRPRDIQARIRAGETPESVAQAARTTVEAIMPFAAPVIAERQHVAERAQRSSVRRTAQSGGARTLGDAVAGHLRGLNVDPDLVEWDSARREDGKWTLTADYSTSARSGSARFTFDAPGNYVVAENDDAGWLLGDPGAPTVGASAAGDDISRARARRRAAVADEDQLPLGDDALSLVSDKPDDAATLGSETGVEAYLDDEAGAGDEAEAEGDVVAELDEAEQSETDTSEDPATEPDPEPERRKPAKKRGRASVPSWDEIMFGSSESDRA